MPANGRWDLIWRLKGETQEINFYVNMKQNTDFHSSVSPEKQFVVTG